MISKKTRIIIFVILVAFIGIAAFSRIQIEDERSTIASSVCSVYRSNVQIGATAAYVFDIKKNQILFEKNGNQQMPLASLTKLMTALIAHESLGQVELITISSESFEPEGDSGFFEGEVWNVDDLIDFTLMTSSNDGAHTLALETMQEVNKSLFEFKDLMNLKASELGLNQTYFLNETGLDVSSSTSGAYGSARDIAYLLSHVKQTAPETFNASANAQKTFTSVSGFEHEATHTSKITSEIAGGVIAKTGFTDLAGGNLAVIAEPILGRPVAIVVLQSSREARDSDVIKLYEFSKKALKRSIICEGPW